jgi:ribosome biogenesis GTPase A
MSAKIVIHNSEFMITGFLARMAMKNKTVLKTLVLPGFKNDQRKFLEGFAKLFLTLFFCNEQLDWLLIERHNFECQLHLPKNSPMHNCQNPWCL